MFTKEIVLRSGDVQISAQRIVQVETRTLRGGTIANPRLFYRFDDGQVVEAMRGDRCIHKGIVWEPVQEND